jgi:repressor LexA
MGGKLTERQKMILDFILSEVEKRRCPPTFREIGKKFGIKSTNGVNVTLKALEKKGYLKRRLKVSRGMEIVGGAFRYSKRVPILGRVAAGEPLLAEQNIDGEISVDNSYFEGENVFALRVRGDSMEDAGIFDGDHVFVRQQPACNSGDIVVAIIGDEATVKYYYPEKGKIRLEPANENYGPIIIEDSTPGFRIIGKVIGLIRKM